MENKEYFIVRGTVQQIVFYNDENCYAVLRLIAEDTSELTATGIFPNVGLGEELILTGTWVSHPSYGEQFASETFERYLPTSVHGIVEYLGSGMIRGIGARLAAKIVQRFGEETFDILMYAPLRLTDIRGITEQKAMDFCRQFTEKNEMRMLMDFLNEHQLPISLTPLLYKRLGANAVEALCENPYILCEEYYDVDFQVADGLAMQLGLSCLSEERADAGVIYALSFNLRNGHTFIPVEKLIAVVQHLLTEEDVEIADTHVEKSILRLCEGGQIVREFIAGRDAAYLATIHQAESYLADTLCGMAKRVFDFDFDVDALLSAVTEVDSVDYSDKQKKAMEVATKNGLVILTGGPGTGKTTTVRGILDVFDALGLHTLLAAPTGRAAKRLSELCDREAKTIHRLLEAGYAAGGRIAFARNVVNPLECDAVILDEVSMIDITLMQALLEALPPGVRLVLVGDADQLPPVGPGNFLHDIIHSRRVETIVLEQIFRQAQESNIVMNAHAVNRGEPLVQSGADGDFFILKQKGTARVMETVVQLCERRLPNHYGFSPSEIQVIAPSKHQGSGTVPLNAQLQMALNPPAENKPEKRFGETIFREGDRVMQTRNNYDIIWEKADGAEQGEGVFNGDVGEIVSIYPDQECLVVRFDDKLTTYSFDMLGELDLAYAITVHKAQGSEFEAVVLALSDQMPRKLLTRNLLYTAITRAKRLMVIVGDAETIAFMAGNKVKGRRYSALRVRMHEGEGLRADITAE